MRFPCHTPDTAVGKAADLLTDIIERHGSAGTTVRTMAGSASILAGYLDPSSISDDDVRGLRDLGLSDREILDIVGLVALNVLTGTFNLVAGLRLESDTRQVA